MLDRFRALGSSLSWKEMSERFEQVVVLVLMALIVVVVASATWHLALAVLDLLLADQVDPANPRVFQTVFGMIFTVIIALEFKHSLMVVLARQESVVRVRSVVLIAMLAVVRKFIVFDFNEAPPFTLFALAAAILALGIVYWLVRPDGPAARPAGAERAPGD